MNAPAHLVMLTRTSVLPEQWQNAVDLWSKPAGRGAEAARFANQEASCLVELAAIASLEELPRALAERAEREAALRPHLSGDWSREVLVHVEDVVPQTTSLPATQRLELRYIEVPLSAYDEYRAWRRRTIFPSVSRHSQVQSFSAYQSLFSTRPGVTFVVGFSCPVPEYRAVYETEEYRSILVTAGRQFIRGGRAGLETMTFERV
jgi:hypothetical protein